MADAGRGGLPFRGQAGVGQRQVAFHQQQPGQRISETCEPQGLGAEAIEDYSTSSDQPSSTCFTLLMNWSARAPSIRRWSKLSERRQMERMAMASSITTGVFSTVPTPMMATCGWLMMGVPTRL